MITQAGRHNYSLLPFSILKQLQIMPNHTKNQLFKSSRLQPKSVLGCVERGFLVRDCY